LNANRGAQLVVVGGAGIDYVIRAPRLPSREESPSGDVFLRDAGGKGLNQAIAASRLGMRSLLVACVGEDRAGDDVMAALAEDHVSAAGMVRTSRAPTARTLIAVDANGGKQTVSYPGANHHLTEAHVSAGLFTGAAVLLVQLEIPMPTVRHTARAARRCGALVVLDAAPARSVPGDLLQLADVVSANRVEAEELSGTSITDQHSAVAAARAILARGPRLATIGAHGGRAVVVGNWHRWLPNYDVDTVDETGAGDACAAALAVGLSEGRSFEDACELAHAAAALATTRVGARQSLPSRKALEELRHAAPAHASG
jgi:ribokinase